MWSSSWILRELAPPKDKKEHVLPPTAMWVCRWGAPSQQAEKVEDGRAMAEEGTSSSSTHALVSSDWFMFLVLKGMDDPKELGRAWHERLLSWKDQVKRVIRLGVEKPAHRMQWHVGSMVNCVTIVGGMVVFGDDDSAIHCVSKSEALQRLNQSRPEEAVSAPIPIPGSGGRSAHPPAAPAVSKGSPTFSVKDSHIQSFKHAEEGDPERLWSVYPAGEGHVFSGGVDAVVRLWCLESGECVREYRGHEGSVSSISVQGNKMVSASADRTLKIWDTGSGACLHTLEGHAGVVTSVATTPEVIVSGSADSTCRVWDLHTGRLRHALEGHTEQVRAVAVQRDTVVSGSWDTTVRVWDLATGSCRRVLHGTEAVWSVAMSGNLIVSGEKEGTIKMWDASTWQCMHTLHAHGGLVRSVCIGADTLLSVSDDGNLEWHDLRVGV